MDTINLHLHRLTPDQVAAMASMSRTLIRDWRRREILHRSFGLGDDGMTIHEVCELAYLQTLAQHGIGPKGMNAFAFPAATRIMIHVLREPAVWTSEAEHSAYWATRSDAFPPRYAVAHTVPHGTVFGNDPMELLRDCSTVVDLEALAYRIVARAERPFLSGTIAALVASLPA